MKIGLAFKKLCGETKSLIMGNRCERMRSLVWSGKNERLRDGDGERRMKIRVPVLREITSTLSLCLVFHSVLPKEEAHGSPRYSCILY